MKWKVYLFGLSENEGIQIEGINRPNWFRRFMGWLLLGHKWVKMK